jgi:hypothetical protein
MKKLYHQYRIYSNVDACDDLQPIRPCINHRKCSIREFTSRFDKGLVELNTYFVWLLEAYKYILDLKQHLLMQ